MAHKMGLCPPQIHEVRGGGGVKWLHTGPRIRASSQPAAGLDPPPSSLKEGPGVGHVAAVRELLQAKAAVDGREAKGATALPRAKALRRAAHRMDAEHMRRKADGWRPPWCPPPRVVQRGDV